MSSKRRHTKSNERILQLQQESNTRQVQNFLRERIVSNNPAAQRLQSVTKAMPLVPIIAKKSSNNLCEKAIIDTPDKLLDHVLDTIQHKKSASLVNVVKPRHLSEAEIAVFIPKQLTRDIVYLSYDPTPPCKFKNVYWLKIVKEPFNKTGEYFALTSHGITLFNGEDKIDIYELETWVSEKIIFDQLVQLPCIRKIRELSSFQTWKKHVFGMMHKRTKHFLSSNLIWCQPTHAKFLLKAREIALQIQSSASKCNTNIDLVTSSIFPSTGVQLKHEIITDVNVKSCESLVLQLRDSLLESLQKLSLEFRISPNFEITTTSNSEYGKNESISAIIVTIIRLADFFIVEAFFQGIFSALMTLYASIIGTKAVNPTEEGLLSSIKSFRLSITGARMNMPTIILPQRMKSETIITPTEVLSPPAATYQCVFQLQNMNPPTPLLLLNVNLAKDSHTLIPSKDKFLNYLNAVVKTYIQTVDKIPRIIMDRIVCQYVIKYCRPYYRHLFGKIIFPISSILLNHTRIDEIMHEIRSAVNIYSVEAHLLVKNFVPLLDQLSHLQSLKIITSIVGESIVNENNFRLNNTVHDLCQTVQQWVQFRDAILKIENNLQVGCFVVNRQSLIQNLLQECDRQLRQLCTPMPEEYYQFLKDFVHDITSKMKIITSIPDTVEDCIEWLECLQLIRLSSTGNSRPTYEARMSKLNEYKNLVALLCNDQYNSVMPQTNGMILSQRAEIDKQYKKQTRSLQESMARIDSDPQFYIDLFSRTLIIKHDILRADVAVVVKNLEEYEVLKSKDLVLSLIKSQMQHYDTLMNMNHQLNSLNEGIEWFALYADIPYSSMLILKYDGHYMSQIYQRMHAISLTISQLEKIQTLKQNIETIPICHVHFDEINATITGIRQNILKFEPILGIDHLYLSKLSALIHFLLECIEIAMSMKNNWFSESNWKVVQRLTQQHNILLHALEDQNNTESSNDKETQRSIPSSITLLMIEQLIENGCQRDLQILSDKTILESNLSSILFDVETKLNQIAGQFTTSVKKSEMIYLSNIMDIITEFQEVEMIIIPALHEFNPKVHIASTLASQMQESITVLQFIQQVQKYWLRFGNILFISEFYKFCECNDQNLSYFKQYKEILAAHRAWAYHIHNFEESSSASSIINNKKPVFMDTLIQTFGTVTYSCSSKAHIIEMCEMVEIIVNQFMETTRKQCTRLYFVQNGNLMALLNNNCDILKITRVIQTCFRGVQDIQFGLLKIEPIIEQPQAEVKTNSTIVNNPTSHSSNNYSSMNEALISSIYANKDIHIIKTLWYIKSNSKCKSDSIDFELNPIKLIGLPTYWCNELSQFLEQYVIQCLKNGLQSIKYVQQELFSYLPTWLTEYPMQLLTVLFHFHFCQLLNKVIVLRPKYVVNQRQILHTIAKQHQLFLEQVIANIRTQSLINIKYENIIMLSKWQNDILTNLTTTANTQDWVNVYIEWQYHFKFNQQNEKIYASMDNVRVGVGYELNVIEPLLIITPLTERCIYTLLHTMQSHSCVAMVQNDDHDVQHHRSNSLLRGLSSMLLRFTMAYACSSSVSTDFLQCILTGIQLLSGFCVVNNFFSLPIGIRSILLKALQTIKERQSSTIVSSTQYSELSKGVLFFPVQGMAPTITKWFNCPFRPITLTFPDQVAIVRILLSSKGFADSFAGSIDSIFQTIKEVSRESCVVLTIQLIKQCLHVAWEILRRTTYLIQYKDSHQINTTHYIQDASTINIIRYKEANVLRCAMLIVMEPIMMSMNLLDAFHRALDVYLPSSMVMLQANRVLHSAIVIAMEKSNLIPTESFLLKCIELHNIFQSGMCPILLGASGIGKTLCLKVLLRAISMIETMSESTVAFQGKSTIHPVINLQVLSFHDILYSTTLTKFQGTILTALFDDTDNEFVTSNASTTAINHESSTSPLLAAKYQCVCFDTMLDESCIDQLQSILDRNQYLTSPNGERYRLKKVDYFVIEVGCTLHHFSPAIISRCVVLSFLQVRLDYSTLIRSWVLKNVKQWQSMMDTNSNLSLLVEKSLIHFTEKALVPFFESSAIHSMYNFSIRQMTCNALRLLACFMTPKGTAHHAVAPPRVSIQTLEKVMLLALIWGFGCHLNKNERDEFNSHITTQSSSTMPLMDGLNDLLSINSNLFEIMFHSAGFKFVSYNVVDGLEDIVMDKGDPVFPADPYRNNLIIISPQLRFVQNIFKNTFSHCSMLIVGPSNASKSYAIKLLQSTFAKVSHSPSNNVRVLSSYAMIKRSLLRPSIKMNSDTNPYIFIDDIGMPPVAPIVDNFERHHNECIRTMEMLRFVLCQRQLFDITHFTPVHKVICAAVSSTMVYKKVIQSYPIERLLKTSTILHLSKLSSQDICFICNTKMAYIIQPQEFTSSDSSIVQFTVQMYFQLRSKIQQDVRNQCEAFNPFFNVHHINEILINTFNVSRPTATTDVAAMYRKQVAQVWMKNCYAVFSNKLQLLQHSALRETCLSTIHANISSMMYENQLDLQDFDESTIWSQGHKIPRLLLADMNTPPSIEALSSDQNTLEQRLQMAIQQHCNTVQQVYQLSSNAIHIPHVVSIIQLANMMASFQNMYIINSITSISSCILVQIVAYYYEYSFHTIPKQSTHTELLEFLTQVCIAAAINDTKQVVYVAEEDLTDIPELLSIISFCVRYRMDHLILRNDVVRLNIVKKMLSKVPYTHIQSSSFSIMELFRQYVVMNVRFCIATTNCATSIHSSRTLLSSTSEYPLSILHNNVADAIEDVLLSHINSALTAQYGKWFDERSKTGAQLANLCSEIQHAMLKVVGYEEFEHIHRNMLHFVDCFQKALHNSASKYVDKSKQMQEILAKLTNLNKRYHKVKHKSEILTLHAALCKQLYAKYENDYVQYTNAIKETKESFTMLSSNITITETQIQKLTKSIENEKQKLRKEYTALHLLAFNAADVANILNECVHYMPIQRLFLALCMLLHEPTQHSYRNSVASKGSNGTYVEIGSELLLQDSFLTLIDTTKLNPELFYLVDQYQNCLLYAESDLPLLHSKNTNLSQLFRVLMYKHSELLLNDEIHRVQSQRQKYMKDLEKFKEKANSKANVLRVLNQDLSVIQMQRQEIQMEQHEVSQLLLSANVELCTLTPIFKFITTLQEKYDTHYSTQRDILYYTLRQTCTLYYLGYIRDCQVRNEIQLEWTDVFAKHHSNYLLSAKVDIIGCSLYSVVSSTENTLVYAIHDLYTSKYVENIALIDKSLLCPYIIDYFDCMEYALSDFFHQLQCILPHLSYAILSANDPNVLNAIALAEKKNQLVLLTNCTADFLPNVWKFVKRSRYSLSDCVARSTREKNEPLQFQIYLLSNAASDIHPTQLLYDAVSIIHVSIPKENMNRIMHNTLMNVMLQDLYTAQHKSQCARLLLFQSVEALELDIYEAILRCNDEEVNKNSIISYSQNVIKAQSEIVDYERRMHHLEKENGAELLHAGAQILSIMLCSAHQLAPLVHIYTCSVKQIADLMVHLYACYKSTLNQSRKSNLNTHTKTCLEFIIRQVYTTLSLRLKVKHHILLDYFIVIERAEKDSEMKSHWMLDTFQFTKPNTGFKMSVLRRLSSSSHIRRNSTVKAKVSGRDSIVKQVEAIKQSRAMVYTPPNTKDCQSMHSGLLTYFNSPRMWEEVECLNNTVSVFNNLTRHMKFNLNSWQKEIQRATVSFPVRFFRVPTEWDKGLTPFQLLLLVKCICPQVFTIHLKLFIQTELRDIFALETIEPFCTKSVPSTLQTILTLDVSKPINLKSVVYTLPFLLFIDSERTLFHNFIATNSENYKYVLATSISNTDPTTAALLNEIKHCLLQLKKNVLIEILTVQDFKSLYNLCYSDQELCSYLLHCSNFLHPSKSQFRCFCGILCSKKLLDQLPIHVLNSFQIIRVPYMPEKTDTYYSTIEKATFNQHHGAHSSTKSSNTSNLSQINSVRDILPRLHAEMLPLIWSNVQNKLHLKKIYLLFLLEEAKVTCYDLEFDPTLSNQDNLAKYYLCRLLSIGIYGSLICYRQIMRKIDSIMETATGIAAECTEQSNLLTDNTLKPSQASQLLEYHCFTSLGSHQESLRLVTYFDAIQVNEERTLRSSQSVEQDSVINFCDMIDAFLGQYILSYHHVFTTCNDALQTNEDLLCIEVDLYVFHDALEWFKSIESILEELNQFKKWYFAHYNASFGEDGKYLSEFKYIKACFHKCTVPLYWLSYQYSGTTISSYISIAEYLHHVEMKLQYLSTISQTIDCGKYHIPPEIQKPSYLHDPFAFLMNLKISSSYKHGINIADLVPVLKCMNVDTTSSSSMPDYVGYSFHNTCYIYNNNSDLRLLQRMNSGIQCEKENYSKLNKVLTTGNIMQIAWVSKNDIDMDSNSYSCIPLYILPNVSYTNLATELECAKFYESVYVKGNDGCYPRAICIVIL